MIDYKQGLNISHEHYKNMADNIMNRTIKSIMTAFIAVILLASAFIPVAINQIGAIANMVVPTVNGKPVIDIGLVTNLLTVVIIVVIAGIIIGVIYTYTSDDDSNGGYPPR